MKTFDYKVPVQVTEAEHPLQGKTGRVQRIRISDNGAWIRFHEDIPKDLRQFPNDHDDRKNDLVLYPDQCEPA